jgi:hypothetical protein
MKFNDQLIEYIKRDCWKKSLMITGQWGVGKTTAVNKFLEDYKNLIIEDNKKASDILKYTHYCKINGFEIDKNFDLKEFIVKNSFNLKTGKIDPLFDNLINKGLNNLSKIPKPIRNIAKNIANNTEISAKIAGSGVTIKCKDLLTGFYNDHMQYVYEETDISKCIIVIDEIDRKYSLEDNNLKIILSKMIDVMENYKNKIIFVVNKDLISPADNKLIDSWNEKLFDSTIEIKDIDQKTIIPDYFSELFKKHVQKNIQIFSNYRSVNKYNQFCSVIDYEFKRYENNNDMKSTIIEFKETLFYVICLSDNEININYENLDSLNEDKQKTKKYSSMLFRPHIDLIKQFINFNYTPLFNKINEELEDFKGESGKINYATNKFLRSYYICHRKGHQNALPDSLLFVLNTIKTHQDYLSITYTKKRDHEMSFWVYQAIELKANNKIRDRLFDLIIKKIDIYFKESKKLDKLKLLDFKLILDHMVTKYNEDFNRYKKFLECLQIAVDIYINEIDTIIFNNISIKDDDILLKHYLWHYDKTLEDIIEKSDDFIDDLRKLRGLNPDKYAQLRDAYLIKYPKDTDRHITKKMFDNADRVNLL